MIHTLTSVEQWRYVPTHLNPADIASRGLFPEEATSADLWFHGPQFLLGDRSEWPEQPAFVEELQEDDPEMKKTKVCSTHFEPTNDNISYLLNYYSKFRALQRTVAWLLRYKQFLRSKVSLNCDPPPRGLMTVEELTSATMAIVKATQRQSFSDVLCLLHDHPDFDAKIEQLTKDQLKKFPCLRLIQSLSPYLVKGVLRVGGRLQNAPVEESVKHPILLPSKHAVTKLLIMFYYYVKEGHMGTSHTLNALNQEYWILKGRSTVKEVLRSCLNGKFCFVSTYFAQKVFL